MRGLVLFVIFFISTGCCCQELSYKQFTVKDGLPGSIVYQSLQDRNGFIWFATNQGVSRFDGRVFRNYTKEDGLPDNDILKLYLDKHDNIWFISFMGVPSVLYHNSIIRFDSCLAVRSICEDALSDSIIMMSMNFNTALLGYYRSVNRPGGWKFSGTLASIHHNQYFSIKVLRMSSEQQHLDFSFSIRTDSTQQVFVRDGVAEKCYAVRADVHSNWLPYSRQQYFTLTSDQKGLVFVVGDSLYYADVHGLQPTLNLRQFNLRNTERDDVNGLFYENDSTLWVSSRSGGLLRINNFRKETRSGKIYFPNSYCTSILKDREGGYWITTHSDGVYYLPNLSFFSVSAFPDLMNKSVRSIKSINPREVVAGFSNGNIMLLDNSGLSSRLFPEWAARNMNNRIMDIATFKDHTLMVGTDAGLFQISRQGVSRPYSLPFSIKAFFVRSDSCIVTASSDGIRYVRKGCKDDSLMGPRATCVAERGRDYYWGTLQGMYMCHGGVTSYVGGRSPALAGVINHIDIAADSTIWVSTEQGLVILRGAGLILLKKDQGLSSNLCKHVSFDDHTAWVSTDKGISRIDYQWDQDRLRNSISTITEEDGLRANDVNQTAVGGDYVWAATARGISFFSRSYISHSVWQPLINVTRIINGDTSLIADTIVLGPQKNRLLIELAGISYRSGKLIRYEYRLRGLDSNWSLIAGNTIELSRLPFGQYVFEARAIDRWGKESVSPRTFVIIHSPPFWQTSWFFVSSYLVMAILIGMGFYTFHRFRQRKKEKEYRLKKKMQDLEMMALRAQMNPHFIFNCLTSIQYHIMRADSKNASTYLHKFSTLIRQTLQNSAASVISLREEVKLLELYMDLEKLRFGGKMEYRIELSPELEPDRQFIPSMIIQPYVENAIKHGIGPLENDKGIILVRFRRASAYIECMIEDNGPGIGASRSRSELSEEGHRSMGTSITENRIDTLNLLRKEKIRLRIIDKEEAGRAESGTIIQLYFPIASD